MIGTTHIRFASLIMGLAVLAVLLSACASFPTLQTGHNDTTLTSSSYAAADMLMQQSHAVINTKTPLYIGVLTDMQAPGELTAFGQMVASHIGARFVQLGYTVNMSSFDEMMMMKESAAEKAAATDAGQTYIPAAPDGAPDPDRVMITGNYAVAGRQVLVNLRLINPSSGRVLAAYDYAVKKTSDIRALTRKESDKDGLFSF